MSGSGWSKYSIGWIAALLGAGCSLGDFEYLSQAYGQAGTSPGGAGGGGEGAGGSGAAAGVDAGAAPPGGSSGDGGSAGSSEAGSAGSGASAGSGVEDQFFCDPKYAVFGASVEDGDPPVSLPDSGHYIVHKYGAAAECLITPDWPELGANQYYAITHECGGPGGTTPAEEYEVWHLEHLCSDVYRFTMNHDTSDQRQLAVVDFSKVGTPLYSVPTAGSVDPSMLFQLRFEELIDDSVRWRFSPVIQSSSCMEQSGAAHYGELDVTRVVLFPCTGNASLQSWNLLPLP